MTIIATSIVQSSLGRFTVRTARPFKAIVPALLAVMIASPSLAQQEGGRPPAERGAQDGAGNRGGQDGGRGQGGGGGGGGGNRGMRGFMGGGGGGGLMRRFADGFRPEFMRRDMPMMRTKLDLDAGQTTLVETLLVDYEEAFTPASQEAQEKLRESMTEIATSFFNPEMRERMEKTMQTIRADLEQLAAESGGEVDPEVRSQLFRDRFSKIQEELIREREQSGATQQTKETIGKMIDVIEGWHRARTGMRDQLLDGIRVTLSEAQNGNWAAFDRYMRRERTLPLGVLSGEQVNLFMVVDEAGLTPEIVQQITPILDRYETDLDAALVARNQYLESSEIRFLRAAQSSNQREVEDTAKRSTDLHKVVRDVNDRFRVELVTALPEENRAKVERAALVAGYERVYRPTQVERSFEMVLEWEEITPEVRAAVELLQTQYTADVGPLNERIITAQRKQEPLDVIEQSTQLIAMMNGMPPMGGRGFGRGGPGGGDDATQEMFTKRGELNDAYVRRLKDLLSPEQQAELPQRGRGGRFGGGGGEGGGLLGSGRIADMPEGIREQVKRFDTNNDGTLDDTERAAAMDAMRREFGGGRGGAQGEGRGAGRPPRDGAVQ